MSAFRFSDSIDELHERASTARGLNDFGEDDYSIALKVLCQSLDKDAYLTPVGEFTFQNMIQDALEARLLCEAGWRNHPEAAATPMERPLFIIGLPRTGTTALHHLIGQDPNMQTLEHWMQRTPKPRPDRKTWEADPDFAAAAARVEMIFARSPEMRAIHEIEAHLPDECWNSFAQNFTHSSYQANADVRGYANWWSTVDMRPTYRRHRRTAQLIGSKEIEKRWIFKDATHLFAPEALLEVYPDAMIVQTHRDPVPVIASVCSLCSSSREPLNEGTDIEAFARSTLALWGRSVDSMMDMREKRASGEKRDERHSLKGKQFYDLPFERIVADPVGAIRDVYAHFEIEYTQAADDAISRFRMENPKGQHGQHTYSLKEYGLSEGEVRERFRRYIESR